MIYYTEAEHKLMKCLVVLINRGSVRVPAIMKGSGLTEDEVNQAMATALQNSYVSKVEYPPAYMMNSLGLVTVETYSRWRVVESENNAGGYSF